MPNWVFNKIRFYGDPKRIAKIRKFMTTGDNEFDFNKLIPMPEELNMTSGSEEDFAIKCAKAYNDHCLITTDEYEKSTWYKEKMPFMDWVNLGNKYLENKRKYGATTWYDWCWNNWGTKWNACDVCWEGDNFVSFNTAWNCPEPVLQKLSEKFKDVEFEGEFADEDLGSNCGNVNYFDGHFSVDYVNEFEFACDVWGYDPSEFEEEEEYV